MTTAEMTTLAEAQDWLRQNLEDGEKCPCCTQFAKIYRRKINAGMARALITQWNAVGQNYTRTTRIAPFTHEAAQLSWWDLIEDDQARRDDGGRSGLWRITDIGKQFVLNRLRVPKYALIYDGRLLRLDWSDSVDIAECLGTKFDYHDLMEGV